MGRIRKHSTDAAQNSKKPQTDEPTREQCSTFAQWLADKEWRSAVLGVLIGVVVVSTMHALLTINPIIACLVVAISEAQFYLRSLLNIDNSLILTRRASDFGLYQAEQNAPILIDSGR